jgi:transposase InsO family protein
VGFLCRYYRVSRSGYYAWKRKPESRQADANRVLRRRIVRIHARSRRIYGSPRVWEALRQQGVACGENRVARLMRGAGLTGRVVRVTRRQPGLQRFYQATDNLRRLHPKPSCINQQWVGDVTYLKAGNRPCFLAVVMDVYSRKVVGWRLGADRTVNLTARAMQQALRHRSLSPGLIFHSDRGIEYGAYRYRDLLAHHGIRPSMNRPRCCQDNAHMESFFHSMKAEWIRGRSFASLGELEAALRAYMRFYNQRRLHSGIDYHTPEEYERLAA